MATREQLKEAVAQYATKELAGKTAGLKKWAILLALPSILAVLDDFLNKNKALLITAGYMTEDGMIDTSRLVAEAKEIARSTGAVTEHFPILGDITFREDDIESLARLIGGTNETN